MKVKKVPMRKCVGCMESKPKKELIRIIADENGAFFVDRTGKAQGRGVYLCPNIECFNIARKKKAIARSLKMTISDDALNQLSEELSTYYEEKG